MESVRWLLSGSRLSGKGRPSSTSSSSSPPPGAAVHLRGVSIAYLSSLRDDVLSLGADSEQRAERAGWSTQAVLENVLLPRMRRMSSEAGESSCFMELVPAAHVGGEGEGASVVHARSPSFDGLVSSLVAHFNSESASLDESFVWLDVICAPQDERAQSQWSWPWSPSRSSQHRRELSAAVRLFPQRLVFLDQWEDPAPLRRSWCVSDLLPSLDDDDDDDDDEETGTSVHGLLAPGQKDEFLAFLLEDPSRAVADVLARLDARHTQSGRAADKEAIDAAVAEHRHGEYQDGVTWVSGKLLALLRAWTLRVSREAAEDALSAPATSHEDAVGAAWMLQRCSEHLSACAQYEEALGLSREALARRRSLLGEDDPAGIVQSLNSTAVVCNLLGHFSEATALLVEARELIAASGAVFDAGDGLLLVATTAYNTGKCLRYQNKNSLAKQEFTAALRIREAELGENHRFVGEVLTELGILERVDGSLRSSLAIYERALAIARSGGQRNMDVARSLQGMGVVFDGQGRLSDALGMYKKALAVCLEKVGGMHAEAARIRNGVAVVFFKQGRLRESKHEYKQVLSVLKATLGEFHPNVADATFNLSMCMSSGGDSDEAFALLNRAVDIYTTSLGPDNERTQSAMRIVDRLQRLALSSSLDIDS